MGEILRRLPWYLLATLPCSTGCIPYAVGTTAHTVPDGERIPNLIWYTIPNGLENLGDSTGLAFISFDIETRVGVSDRADAGLRIPSLSGIVLNYKYRIFPDSDLTAPAISVMGGMGIVNLGNHGYFELTLLASGTPTSSLTPYGGLRASQVVPMSSGAVSDSPTLGGFMGVRIGREQMGVSAEVGLYYDRSALDLRSSNVIVVPALTIHGSELIRILSRAMGGR